MKKTFLAFTLILGGYIALGQQHNFDKTDNLQSLSERLSLLEKKSDKCNIFLNMQSSFDAVDEGDKEWGGRFRMGHLRLEIRGYINDKLFYRLRHRLNKGNEANSLDNISDATDMMYAGYHFSDKFTFILGKQCQYWGGFEYDLNPIYVYEFSDFDNNVDCFMTGATFSYTPTKDHEIALQITDSRASRFETVFAGWDMRNYTESKMPLTYILNWNGHLFDNKIITRWSVKTQTETKDKFTHSVALGTKLNLEKFQLCLDYMRDNSELDRLRIVSSDMKKVASSAPYETLLPMNSGYKLFENTTYNSFIAKAEYQPATKWNLFAKGMYETATAKELANNFRTSYGYLAGVEYMPFKDEEMRLFITYVGRKVVYGKDVEGLDNFNTNRVSLGIIYRIKAF